MGAPLSPLTRRHLLRASALTGTATLALGTAEGAAGAAASAATAPAAAATTALAINPRPANEAANMKALRDALDAAARGEDAGWGRSEGGRILVKATSGPYIVKDTLMIGGNTHLDAGTSQFQAAFPTVAATYVTNSDIYPAADGYPATVNGRAVDKPATLHTTMLCNYVPTDTPGYLAPGNIRVTGGSWDPSYTYLNQSGLSDDDIRWAVPVPPMNVLTFEHTANVLVENVTISNVRSWHGIELNAVKYATVSGCTLKGWIPDLTQGQWHGEAVQLDMANDATAWGGRADNTPCTDIRILRNTCAPSGSRAGWGQLCGSHTGVNGHIHTDVLIEGNKVTDTVYDAIGATNTQHVVIRANDVQNCVGGILVKAFHNALTTVDIASNVVSLASGSQRHVVAVVAAAATGTEPAYPVDDVHVVDNRGDAGAFRYDNAITFRYGADHQEGI